jgi:BlaI family penicillinase repressor
MKEPSEAQLEILQVLWENEPATVRFVHEKLSEVKEVQYTTTLKQIQRMVEKGMLTAEKSGKSYLYSTKIKESQVKKSMFNRLVDSTFRGSAMDLVMHALGQAKPSDDELEELRKWLEEKKQKDNND